MMVRANVFIYLFLYAPASVTERGSKAYRGG